MNSNYKYLELDNLEQYQDRKPIIKEPYRTIQGVFKNPVISTQSFFDNSPDTFAQNIIEQEFIKTEPSPTVQSLLETYDAEIFPTHTGLLNHITDRDSNMLPTPLEFSEQNTIISDYRIPKEQTQQDLNNIQSLPKNLVHLYDVPKASVSKNNTRSHNPKCNKEWKINKKIISQIRDQSVSPSSTDTNSYKKVPIFTMNMDTPVDTSVSTTSSAAKHKPNILNKTRKRTTIHKSVRYDKLKSLVQTLELIDQARATKRDKVHSRIRKTTKIMYTLTVEIAKLSQEDHLQSLSLFQSDSRHS